jgi:GT2 family glycosyltransferase
MLVSIIIINFNTFELTCQCLESIKDHVRDVPYEVVLVDNASREKDPEKFKERFPFIKLIKSSTNLGFSKGNNLGIASASGDTILLLNSDAYLREDCISPVASKLDESHLGAVSVKLLYPDGRFQHTARRFRSIRNELLDLIRPLLLILSYRERAKLMLNQYFEGDFDTECDWVSGAFFMFRKEILTHLPNGKLDERFFMYGEDQLWCYQFAQLGYTNYYFSKYAAFHIANASTSSAQLDKVYKQMIKSELEIMQLRKGKATYYHIFKAIFVTKELLRLSIKKYAMKIFGHRIN